ncbi:hypothetical protein ACFQ8O_14225 [Streptomyces coelicoflavus]|uniref:hypothetical protein n=1 Tax=Streptomyces coelicoflavus TaxID=285562 RepID=UPI0036987C5E
MADRTGEAAEVSREVLLGVEARGRAVQEATDRFAAVTDVLERVLRETKAARSEAAAARAGAEAAQRHAESRLRQADEQGAGLGPVR